MSNLQQELRVKQKELEQLQRENAVELRGEELYKAPLLLFVCLFVFLPLPRT